MSDPIPYQAGCDECAHIQQQERQAHTDRNPSREADCRVLARRHLRAVHDIQAVVRA